MEIISTDINTILKRLTQPLGVRAKKAELFLETTTNGLSILIKCGDQYLQTFDQNCQVKQDGHVVIMLNDLLLLLPLNKQTNIKQTVDGQVIINGVPVDHPKTLFIQLPTILGHQVKLRHTDFDKMLSLCQSMRRLLKKSIFNESTVLQVTITPEQIIIKHLSPLLLTTKTLSIKQINNAKLTFYLSKNDLRCLALFKDFDIVSFANKEQLLVSSNNFSYIAPKPIVNDQLFNPSYL